MERLDCKKESEILENEENVLQLRHWASLRGQTLCRTGYLCSSILFVYASTNTWTLILIIISIAVRGMMYYRRALKLQAFLDMASEHGKDIIEFPINA